MIKLATPVFTTIDQIIYRCECPMNCSHRQMGISNGHLAVSNGAANLMQLLILHRLNGWQSNNETECTNKALPKWQNQKPHPLHTDPHQFPVGGWNLWKPVHWGSKSFQVRINKWTSSQNSKPPLNIVLHSGWWYTYKYPSEKWWSAWVGIMTFPILRKNNPNVPNHQPVIINHY